ncbi:hypothetical protein Cgig2_027229 [Carnegiea gigantea]|uniref:Protein FAR1-RELATED SEQUENCE n=1 Tax=Carnegiea gigantea TaxID=171969 RepID=A0A9Q1QC09_9CARY|nr:hypothetical protein Cgig2_027229 [Carnegiea gigantea]
MNIGLNEIPYENYEPFIGQAFGSKEEALVFYRNYADERHGFGIRKDRYDKRNNKIVRRDLSCHRARKNPIKIKGKGSPPDVSAMLIWRITLRRVFEIFPEEWHVSRFVKQHNHEVLLPHETCLLPCNRVITPEDEENILLYKGDGLSLEKKVEHGGLPFIEKDIRNLFTKMKKMIALDDAMDLIESMKLAQEANIKKPPKTIITDQDPWMSDTIASEMPTAKHSYCIWHITSKFSGWFMALLRSKYQNWCDEFYMLCKLNSPEAIEEN